MTRLCFYFSVTSRRGTSQTLSHTLVSLLSISKNGISLSASSTSKAVIYSTTVSWLAGRDEKPLWLKTWIPFSSLSICASGFVFGASWSLIFVFPYASGGFLSRERHSPHICCNRETYLLVCTYIFSSQWKASLTVAITDINIETTESVTKWVKPEVNKR